MGVLRFLFALIVVVEHAGLLFGQNILHSFIAVQSFFLISGFYMALILDKKYRGDSARKLFWTNRFLRIFPLYWITLALLFSLTLIKFFFHIGNEDNAIVHYLQWTPDTSPIAFAASIINYIIRNITLIVNADYFFVIDSTPGYLLVQQAWTLQMELLFYLLVPFLVKLSKKIFFIFFAAYIILFFGIIAHFDLMGHNLLFNFLQYLYLFLLGMIAYRHIYKVIEHKKISSNILKTVFTSFLLFTLLFNVFFDGIVKEFFPRIDLLYYGMLFITLPFIFALTKKNNVDGYIGRLSYPMYIIHFLVIKALTNIPSFHDSSDSKTIAAIIITIFISWLALKFIEDPIDAIRQKRIKRLSLARKK